MNTSTTVLIEIFNIGLLSIAGTPVPHMEQRFPAILQSFLSEENIADIICFTEVHEQEHRSAIIDALSQSHIYVTFFDDRIGQRKNNGLLLLSRFPLSEPGFISCANTATSSPTYCGRGVLFANVELPNEKRFRVLCTSIVTDHFGLSAYPGELEHVLGEQLDHVLDVASAGIRDHIIVGGFNCGPSHSKALCLHLLENGYKDIFSAMNTEQGSDVLRISWDPKNPLNALSPYRKRLPRRIDHAFVSMASALVLLQAKMTRSDACVPTSDGLVPLSDHYALQVQLAL